MGFSKTSVSSGASGSTTTTSPTFDFAGSKTLSFYKIDKLVVMTIPDFFAADGGGSNDYAAAAIPSGYIPATDKTFFSYGNTNGFTGVIKIVVLSTGEMEIHDAATGVFGAATSYSLDATALTWVVP